ncbi:tRNA epoxyqueuosine(34) reductase QueG [Asticcacaulis sp. EMRT-3]|uniref:tRNA epoxyqueuosine(34) reductase QueG n=1 Tax=Asticcacaulis sp. EMRT-3 TaxID=3040349 RepID=UPI0024AFAF43|nr:tRNA epoxyqueuosine(34) reductase QueG [Asticcacaulis sp. EMRT-3]MDI7775586.1 tRNA epoxyqueuosine(34) reductase QueG [Asticcacaulis sp. EMRT-3]
MDAPAQASSQVEVEAIRQQAFALGFSVARFTALPEIWAASQRLEAFVAAGYHGQMQWMDETLERRKHPRHMWENAQSALVLGYNYGPDSDPLAKLAHTDLANISVYARNEDYHDLIKKKLKTLATAIVARTGCELKVFVDTAPLMEKPLAQLAGLGWQGKHTNLVSRDFGSWLFLGVILFDRVLAEEAPEADHCGSCRACLDICPTEAFDGPYRLDARKCLSYLTIEYRGAWPEHFRRATGNRIYGCDDCLAACPWNKFAQTAHDIRLHTREGFDGLRLTDLARLDDAGFRALFSKSPVKRIGRESFVRNVVYALGNAFYNSENVEIKQVLLEKLAESSPVVRGAAVWALRQGVNATEFSEIKRHYAPSETDPELRAEWEAAWA